MTDANVPTPAPTGEGANPEAHATDAHAGAPEHHPTPTAFGLAAPALIALAMVLVFAILLWKRVPAIIGRALDSKIAAIRAQLDEAAQLRSEAEAIKAEYESKTAQADAEAAEARIRAAADTALGEIESVAAEAARDLVGKLTGLSISGEEAAAAVKAEMGRG